MAINSVILPSFRKVWTSKNLVKLSTNKKYSLLNSYTGGQSAGIIIETGDTDETKYIDNFNKVTSNNLPIKIVRKWDEEQSLLAFKEYGKVSELKPYHRQTYNGNINNLEEFKIIIMRIYDDSSSEQLLNILPRVHDNGIKIIILVTSHTKFKELLKYKLNSRSELKLKLVNRINIIFPNILDLSY